MISPKKILGYLTLGAILVAAMAAPSPAAPLPGGTLNPLSIAKYVDPLPIPGVMPQTPNPTLTGLGIDYYEIAERQFKQQVLSSVNTKKKPLPQTTVWGYGSVTAPSTFSYPSLSVEATADRPVRVKWLNQLVKDPVACAASTKPARDPACNFLPPLVPVDQTLHWANPPKQCIDPMDKGPDCRGFSQLAYTGPVPMVPHLHGSHVEDHSDGYPEAWFLPAANNIPSKYATVGTNFKQSQIPGAADIAGQALYQYRNDQRATTLWFHDHTVGMTRTNVYSGPTGFYLVRGGPDDLPSGIPGGLPGGAYEIPMLIQDRSFNADGSLFYPDTRAFFDGFLGPYIGDPTVASDVAPLHNPEFFGNTIVVNGKTWPFLNVEPRKYRFRILNGSDSRFFVLDLNNQSIMFTQIGSEGGFLPAPVILPQLLVGPAERADVIVDFSNLLPGAKVFLRNSGPDSPFGGFPIAQADLADSQTTGQVMLFNVVASTDPDTSAIPALPGITPIDATNANIRQVSLNEDESALICVDPATNLFVAPAPCPPGSVPAAPISARLGTVVNGVGVPMNFMDPITETPGLNGTEIWEINNFTVDAHPIHLHLVMFQVINRTDALGVTTGPEPGETGFKDTVIVYPGGVTRVKAVYDIAGLYLWHCHILSHEDNEMMRPYCVGPLADCVQ